MTLRDWICQEKEEEDLLENNVDASIQRLEDYIKIKK